MNGNRERPVWHGTREVSWPHKGGTGGGGGGGGVQGGWVISGVLGSVVLVEISRRSTLNAGIGNLVPEIGRIQHSGVRTRCRYIASVVATPDLPTATQHTYIHSDHTELIT